MFRSENDVRRWLKKQGPAWWVENKRGGSTGFPDAIAARGGRALFLELKVAQGSERLGWAVKASPAQILTLRELDAAGLDAWLIAGLAGTNELGALKGGQGLIRVGETRGVGRRGLYRVEGWGLRWRADGPWPVGLGRQEEESPKFAF